MINPFINWVQKNICPRNYCSPHRNALLSPWYTKSMNITTITTSSVGHRWAGTLVIKIIRGLIFTPLTENFARWPCASTVGRLLPMGANDWFPADSKVAVTIWERVICIWNDLSNKDNPGAFLSVWSVIFYFGQLVFPSHLFLF